MRRMNIGKMGTYKVRRRMYSNGKRTYMGRKKTFSDVDLDWKIGQSEGHMRGG